MTPTVNEMVREKGVTSVLKRKVPEKKAKCDVCGRMLKDIKGLSLHKKRMHGVPVKNVIPSMSMSRSDSVKSSKSEQSVKSPPPKKQDTKPEEVSLPETEWIDIDIQDNKIEEVKETKKVSATPEQSMGLQEDLRLSKIEAEELKIINMQLREID